MQKDFCEVTISLSLIFLSEIKCISESMSLIMLIDIFRPRHSHHPDAYVALEQMDEGHVVADQLGLHLPPLLHHLLLSNNISKVTNLSMAVI